MCENDRDRNAYATRTHTNANIMITGTRSLSLSLAVYPWAIKELNKKTLKVNDSSKFHTVCLHRFFCDSRAIFPEINVIWMSCSCSFYGWTHKNDFCCCMCMCMGHGMAWCWNLFNGILVYLLVWDTSAECGWLSQQFTFSFIFISVCNGFFFIFLFNFFFLRLLPCCIHAHLHSYSNSHSRSHSHSIYLLLLLDRFNNRYFRK